MLLAIPLAWLQLLRERVRLLVALAGIAFAVILIMMQLGFQEALFTSAVTLHVNLEADIVLISPQSTALIAMKSFSQRRLYQALGFEGVASVSPLYLDFALWKNPVDRSTRQILVIAFDPNDSVISLPAVIANQDQIKLSDVVLFDSASRPEFGPIPQLYTEGNLVETEVSNRRVSVGGLFSLGASFGADGNLITSDVNLIRLLPRRTPGLIDVGLIKLQPGADVEQVMQNLRTNLPQDIQVLSKQGFVDFEKNYWQTATSIGFVFSLGAAMGFIVGTVIVYQVLYTDVSDHLPEYATLKAMGYQNRYLYSVVLQEAVILSLLGFVPGVVICTGLYTLTRNATALPMEMTFPRIVLVFTLTLVMCTLSGAIAMRKVQAADPADIF